MQLFHNLFPTALFMFFTITSAAVITHAPNLLLTSPDPSNTFPNTSLPANQTISSPSNTLPPSPYIYPIPTHLTTTIIFSAYTPPIDELSAIQCILSATEDVQAALEAALRDHDADRAIRERYIRIDAEHATLILATAGRGQMTWSTWGQTLAALTTFLRRWEVVGLKFVVVEEGVMVAVGGLAGR